MTPVDVADMLYAVLLAVVLIFAVKYISAALQAWAQKSNDGQYRSLAERVTATQSEIQATMAGIRADVSKISSSLAAVEKVLKQVE